MRKDLRKKFKKYLESKSALCIYMKMYRERHAESCHSRGLCLSQ